MEGHWNYFRPENSREKSNNLDIEETVEKIILEKILDEPVYEWTYSQSIEYVSVIIDIGMSMRPFSHFSDYVLSPLKLALSPKKLEVLYTAKLAGVDLYLDKGRLTNVDFRRWLSRISSCNLILIISDATAHKGEDNYEYVNQVYKLMKEIQVHNEKILWMNPLPRRRWIGTPAFFISMMVKMLGAETQDLKCLSKVLKRWK